MKRKWFWRLLLGTLCIAVINLGYKEYTLSHEKTMLESLLARYHPMFGKVRVQRSKAFYNDLEGGVENREERSLLWQEFARLRLRRCNFVVWVKGEGFPRSEGITSEHSTNGL